MCYNKLSLFILVKFFENSGNTVDPLRSTTMQEEIERDRENGREREQKRNGIERERDAVFMRIRVRFQLNGFLH